jgi:hypothetical protein
VRFDWEFEWKGTHFVVNRVQPTKDDRVEHFGSHAFFVQASSRSGIAMRPQLTRSTELGLSSQSIFFDALLHSGNQSHGVAMVNLPQDLWR